MKRKIKYDIFFSYSHLDKEIASDLENRLTKAGFSCFMSEKHVAVTKEWQSVINDAIKNSEYILLLITPRSKHSKWILMEAGAAWILGKKLMPLLQFCSIDEFPEPIRESQAKVIETPSQIDKLLSELIQCIGKRKPIESVSFHDILNKIDSTIKRIREDRWDPELIIGSGRGGAICAGIISTRLPKKAIKVVDCRFKWKKKERITTIDESSLNEKDIKNKEILIVELARQSGDTYEHIKQAISAYKPLGIRSFALIILKQTPSKPDYFAYNFASVPKLPWV